MAIGYLALGRLPRVACPHVQAHVFSHVQVDGTKTETCPRCGAVWVVWPSGNRERLRFCR